ncbi:MAG: hypothetical protein GX591_01450 [Planctomycetes bacterium]|nr:hypothetical protein [Planctomycetota bacterium]
MTGHDRSLPTLQGRRDRIEAALSDCLGLGVGDVVIEAAVRMATPAEGAGLST